MALRHVGVVVAAILTVGCSGTNAGTRRDSEALGSTSATQPIPTSPVLTPLPSAPVDAVSVDDQDACDWVTGETVASAINGAATTVEPRNDDDYRSCSWQNDLSTLSVYFVRFDCCLRSVEAEIGRIGGYANEHLVTIQGTRGAIRRPGVWYGETPLNQYGMAEIVLVHADGSDPDEQTFEAIVAAVLHDVAAAGPGSSW